jgi:hypothetical protein
MQMNSFAGEKMQINLGKWTENGLDRLIRKASLIEDPGRRIAFLSGHFLGLAYKESTLIGDSSTAEVLVVNLSAVDCFTFLDSIEAMRLSVSFGDCLVKLHQVRYRGSRVSYADRKHFFTDWSVHEPTSVYDVTRKIGGERTKSILKTLNLKEDGTPLLHGLMSHQRNIQYIPTEHIDQTVFNRLKTGDYAGICSTLEELDVSHVGIIVREGKTVFFRHASSDIRYRKVIDQHLEEYITGKPGLIILRPKD